MFKKIIAGIGALIGIIFVIGFLNDDNIGLEARADNSSDGQYVISGLTLKNVGTKTLIINDITINDRSDCSSSNTQNTNNSFSDVDRHMAWVSGRTFFGTNLTNNDTKLTNISLGVGDTHTWLSSCATIIRAKVVTNLGSTEYHFYK